MSISRQKILFLAVCVSSITALVFSFLLFRAQRHLPQGSVAVSSSGPLSARPAGEVFNENTFSVLLVGFGGVGHPGGMLADSLTLVHVNTDRKTALVIAIPRDTWVELPVRSDMAEGYKINTSFAIGSDDRTYPLKEPQYRGEHGSGNLAKYAAGQVSGLEVDYYAAIDFARFVRAIDILGGVIVNVPVSFTDNFYPVEGLENETCGFSNEKIKELHDKYSGSQLERQFTCRYESISFKSGTTQMDGAMALKFVRSRHAAEHGGDFARGQRAQAVLVGIKDNLISAGAVANAGKLYSEFSGMIKTDIDLETLLALVEFIGNPKEYRIKFVNLTTDNYLQGYSARGGQAALIPKAGVGNWQEVHEFITSELQ